MLKAESPLLQVAVLAVRGAQVKERGTHWDWCPFTRWCWEELRHVDGRNVWIRHRRIAVQEWRADRIPCPFVAGNSIVEDAIASADRPIPGWRVGNADSRRKIEPVLLKAVFRDT